MDLIGLLRQRDRTVGCDEIRDEMTKSDPDFARVRDIHHDALGALAAKRGADGLAIRRERQFWERSGQ